MRFNHTDSTTQKYLLPGYFHWQIKIKFNFDQAEMRFCIYSQISDLWFNRLAGRRVSWLTGCAGCHSHEWFGWPCLVNAALAFWCAASRVIFGAAVQVREQAPRAPPTPNTPQIIHRGSGSCDNLVCKSRAPARTYPFYTVHLTEHSVSLFFSTKSVRENYNVLVVAPHCKFFI